MIKFRPIDYFIFGFILSHTRCVINNVEINGNVKERVYMICMK